jgi:hypothetical protein
MVGDQESAALRRQVFDAMNVNAIEGVPQDPQGEPYQHPVTLPKPESDQDDDDKRENPPGIGVKPKKGKARSHS